MLTTHKPNELIALQAVVQSFAARVQTSKRKQLIGEYSQPTDEPRPPSENAQPLWSRADFVET